MKDSKTTDRTGQSAALPPPEELLAAYTPMVFRIVKTHLTDPEDIKECVNDTFFEFYRTADRFDPEKGSVSAYLGAIARRNAVDAFRRGLRGPRPAVNGSEETAALTDGPEAAVDDRLLLAQALDTLEPEDVAVIRARYYDGMTLHEIAQAMHLPYETVKKRHQRSLKKLRLVLLALLVLALVGCAVHVLHRLGFTPGLGIRSDGSTRFYTLSEPVTVPLPDTDAAVTFTSLTVENNALVLKYRLENADGSAYRSAFYDDPRYADGLADESLQLGALHELSVDLVGADADGGTVRSHWDTPNSQSLSIDEETGLTTYGLEISDYESGYGKLLTKLDAAEAVTAQITMRHTEQLTKFAVIGEPLAETAYEIEVELPLTRVDAESLDGYAYEYVEGQGGLLAMPRLENGELIVAIYPMHPETGYIHPWLTTNAHYSADGGTRLAPGETLPDPTIYAVAADGTALPGTCKDVDTLGFSGNYYCEWNFGPAEPGEYTLVVPYVLKTYEPSSRLDLGINTNKNTVSGRTYRFDGGTIRLTSIEPTDWDAVTAEGYSCYPEYEDSDDLLWRFTTEVLTDMPDETVTDINFQAVRGGRFFSLNRYSDEEKQAYTVQLSYPTGVGSTWLYVWHDGSLYQQDGKNNDLHLSIEAFDYPLNRLELSADITARWDHRFELAFTVE